MFSVKSLSGKQFEKLFLRRRANPTPIRFLLPGIVGTFRKKKTIDSYAETVPPGTGLPRCPQEFGGSPPGKPGKCHGARPWGGGSGRMALASPRAGVLSFRPDSGHVEMNEHESCSLSALSCFCRAAGPRGSCPPGPRRPFPTGTGIRTCSDALLGPVGADRTPVLFAGPLVLPPNVPPPGCTTLATSPNALSTDFLIREAGARTMPCLPPKATVGIQRNEQT